LDITIDSVYIAIDIVIANRGIILEKLQKKRQSAKDTKTPRLITKNQTWQNYYSEGHHGYLANTKEWRDSFIATLYTFFEDPDRIVFEEFCMEYKIPRRTIYEWREKFPEIAEAVNEIKVLLGARRRKGAMTFKLHYQSSYRDMHIYDQEWGPQVDKHHAALKEESSTQSGIRIVELPAIAETDEVKARKVE